MGEAEIRKSRGVCSTTLLLNWMGETSEQDEEKERTLELSLGLPGGGRRTARREKGKQSAVDGSVDLSLGYSSSQGMEPQRSRLHKSARAVLALFSFFLVLDVPLSCVIYITGTAMLFCDMVKLGYHNHINAAFFRCE